jgi:hypothetical protein
MQSTDDYSVTSAPDRMVTKDSEGPAILAISDSAKNRLGQSDGVIGEPNTKDVEPLAQPIKNPAKPNPGGLIITHLGPDPALDERPAEPTTIATIQEAGARPSCMGRRRWLVQPVMDAPRQWASIEEPATIATIQDNVNGR